MADNNKNYVEAFSNGSGDFYVADAEARADILQLQEDVAQLDPTGVASVAECQAAMNELT